MRYILIGLLLISSVCFADMVCLNKSDGKLIEYQTGTGTLDTLRQNAIRNGHKEKDIIVKNITLAEWEVIRQEQIIQPELDKKAAKAAIKQQKAIKSKQVLGLSDEQWNDLVEAIR